MPKFRQPVDYAFGTLSNPAAITDTSISSAEFASLATNYSSDFVFPVVLHDPSLKQYEVVYVTAHASGNAAVTVLRGREGTTARAWPSGTQWTCAPTAARDGLLTTTASNLPSDAHVGARAVLSDTGAALIQSYRAGWQAQIGAAKPGDIGPKRGGTNPHTDTDAILIRAGTFSGTTNASGEASASFRQPFPNGVIAVVLTSISLTWVGSIVVMDETASGFRVRAYKNTTLDSGTPLVGGQLGYSYLAVGY